MVGKIITRSVKGHGEAIWRSTMRLERSGHVTYLFGAVPVGFGGQARVRTTEEKLSLLGRKDFCHCRSVRPLLY